MYAEQGQNLDEAQELITKALSISPNNGAYVDSLGWVYYKKGMFEEARLELERAQELIGEDAVVYDHLGDAYCKTDMPLRAQEAWKKSLKIKESDEVKKKLENLEIDETCQIIK